MNILYVSEGYFCEGEVGKDWQLNMQYGKILLTDQEISLVKKSKISLTEIGTSVDDFHKDYQIPLTKVKKAYSFKQRKIYTVIIETRDGYIFSLTMADDKSHGKKKSVELSELINAAIINS
ncbi:MAG: hypothetical protein KGD58_12430 [Candidatus Lokiarchaeota archaeon]|nr:hypothetical protein [Candidatus Lokiarchaeota archaeon]